MVTASKFVEQLVVIDGLSARDRINIFQQFMRPAEC